jgi:hypothetical protein
MRASDRLILRIKINAHIPKRHFDAQITIPGLFMSIGFPQVKNALLHRQTL